MVAILPGWQHASLPQAKPSPRTPLDAAAQYASTKGFAALETDRVHISTAARERHATLQSLNAAASIPTTHGGRIYKTLEEVAGDLRQNLLDFDNQITPLFAAAGISTTPPLTLQGDGKGSVNVVGTHPHQAAVAQVFSQENVLVSRFMVAAARNAIVAAGKDPAFRAAYEVDPQRAIRTHIDDLKRNLLGFQMTFGKEGLTTQIV